MTKKVAIALSALIGVIPAPVSALEVPKSSILVLRTDSEFGAYAEEILRAEGLNEFQVESPLNPDLTIEYLSHFDVTILTETKLTTTQAELLTSYVRSGGNLIAFRPDTKLAGVFGISVTGPTIANGYIRVDGQNDLGRGLTRETLQFHGIADGYELQGATSIATFGQDINASAAKPAIVRHEFGKGRAIAFAYNLPKSIVFARQGNPQNAGIEKDGIDGIRATDLFTDGWLNPLKNAVNQADEQLRLVTRAIERLNLKRPLPRLWYFPARNRSLIVLTGDGEDSPEKDFDVQLRDIKSKGARMTLYLKGTSIPATKVKKWMDDGFEVAPHVDDSGEAANPTWNGMEAKMRSTIRAFNDVYGVEPRTIRNHWVVWCGSGPGGKPDFTAQASIEANSGIRLDCNFYHYDQKSSQGHFLGPIGNFNGSGLPMKFIDGAGQILNIYQSITQLPDEQWGPGNLFGNFRILLDRSLDHEVYTVINVNLHTDRWNKWSRKEGLQILDYANRRGAPMWTAERAVRFLQQRNGTAVETINWSNDELSIRLRVPGGEDELTLMVPKSFGGEVVTHVSRDGENTPFVFQPVKGDDYAMIAVTPGNQDLVVKYGDR